MTFDMPVLLAGAMSFQPDNGGRINQLYVMNSDPENTMYKGLTPSKMSCDQIVFDALTSDVSEYPRQVTIKVRNKTSGGKTVQQAVGIVQSPAQKKASA